MNEFERRPATWRRTSRAPGWWRWTATTTSSSSDEPAWPVFLDEVARVPGPDRQTPPPATPPRRRRAVARASSRCCGWPPQGYDNDDDRRRAAPQRAHRRAPPAERLRQARPAGPVGAGRGRRPAARPRLTALRASAATDLRRRRPRALRVRHRCAGTAESYRRCTSRRSWRPRRRTTSDHDRHVDPTTRTGPQGQAPRHVGARRLLRRRRPRSSPTLGRASSSRPPGSGPGDRVLDVAAGSGNASLPAARPAPRSSPPTSPRSCSRSAGARPRPRALELDLAGGRRRAPAVRRRRVRRRRCPASA